ncbi:ATP-dependent nuclease [Planococcus maritimus]|uniref:ATP-dependent nuclease n=1 Tax=Planococcus maritimus TaxID=192421 RepID=UPI00232B0FAA|nr:AAA family ATPase [Planococcus maritimus]
MYLRSISLINFRQFDGTVDKPGITIFFNPNFNVLVGENDSGKTAIIDSIRYLLGSVSEDFDRISQDDFYYRQSEDYYVDNFSIEGQFIDLNEKEAGAFLEWLSFDEENNYQLNVSLRVEKRKNDNGQEFIEKKLLAGDRNFETRLDSKARDILKTTYLKPLRDANSELKPGLRSRLANILKAHPTFKDTGDDNEHKLVLAMQEANTKVENFFEEDYTKGHSLIKDIEDILGDFYDQAEQSKSKSKFSVSKTDLISILRKLSLSTLDINLGLGNQNLLFIATELLLLNKFINEQEIIGPQITLIEEIEAHLHTQAQIRLIKYLEGELEKTQNRNQFILTSHSTNLVSSIDPKNIILVHKNSAYPLSENYTMLEEQDYNFLERFLDSTKSNLFFAKGLIFVEGESEMLLLPALANLIDYPLHKYGISIVNIGGTSFERYIKLFSRSDFWKNEMQYPSIKTPISIVTDLDVKPWSYYEKEGTTKTTFIISTEEELKKVLEHCEESIEDINLNCLGAEYSTLEKLAKNFSFSLKESNRDIINQLTNKEITPEKISELSTEKITSIESKYSMYDANLKVCVSPKWTLEYCIALSPLVEVLLRSIFEMQYKKPYQGKNKVSFDALMSQITERYIVNEMAAYEIFKPLNDKNVSKAEVAQCLAIKLNEISKKPEEKVALKDIIMKDQSLNYLIESILHATSLETREDEVLL